MSEKPHSQTLFAGIPKIPARYHDIVLPFFLSLLMTGIVSLISTLQAVGLVAHILQLWVRAWGLSWLIAFPSLLLVLPVVRKITDALVQKP